MNRIYHLVWNQSLSIWVAVSENAKGHGKSISGRKLIAAALALTGGAFITPLALAAPTGGQISAGAGSIAQAGANTTITQSSQNLAINWQGFSIAANEAVRFDQPNATAIALNRVLGQDPSQILGNLSANGQVFVLNPNGVLFGASAQVNVGGLVASTLNISDTDFIAGNNVFSNGGTAGAVVNQGTLTAANGGYIALLAPEVRNEGVISATLGTALLAAGDKVTLNLNNGSLLSYSIDQGALNALADNKHLIRADGGQVFMSAKAANALTTAMVNNTGIIEARTVQNHNGTIKLMGDMQVGTVNVGGTLDASVLLPSPANGGAGGEGNGGFIETSAAHVKIADDAKVTTAAANGLTGIWLIDPTNFTIAAGSGALTTSGIGATTLSNSLGSTSVIIATALAGAEAGDIFVNSAVTWAANKLTLSAHDNININANLNATSSASLALIYGQGAVASGNTSNVITANGAAVNLPAGTTNFTTLQGSDGVVKNYTVITSLGAAGSTTAADLQGMNGNLGINYALGSNIDATATSAWNSNMGFTPIGNATTQFTGTFDGLGHTICNLTVNNQSILYTGLFGYTGTGSAIRNAGLIGGSVSGGGSVGGLVGHNSGTVSNSYAKDSVSGTGSGVGGLVGENIGTVSNSYATGSVSGTGNVGGLVGNNNGGTVSNSYATGSVSGTDHVGGLAGNNAGAVSNSYAMGSVTGGGANHYYTGGLVGFNEATGSVSNSGATGNVSGYYGTGGLVGINYGTIGNSYATGSVSGHFYVGGMVGYVSAYYGAGTVSNSYATGSVTGDSGSWSIGGLVGESTGTVSTSYATGSVSGAGPVGGLVGNNAGTVSNSYWNSSVNGTLPGIGGGITTGANGLTTAQMRTASNFVGFNFTSTPGAVGNNWVIVNADGTLQTNVSVAVGETYPMLASEYSTTINSVHQLQLMQMAPAASYTLRTNIAALSTGNSTDVWGISGFVPVGARPNTFAGSFDGMGHTISDLTINRLTQDWAGLFAEIGGSGSVRNVGLLGGSITGRDYVGGLTGWNYGSVSNVYTTGSVSGAGNYAGGLVGVNYGSISNVYGAGNASGTYVGGVLAMNYGSLNNAYATGSVGGSFKGELVGYNYTGTVSNSYWNSSVNATGIGLGTTTGATGLTSAEMQQQSNYPSWDFTNTWVMYEGHTTPLLRSFMTPLTVTAANDAKTYNGLAYSGGSVTYCCTPGGTLPSGMGTVNYLAGSSEGATNAGSYTIAPGGLYSDQQGYLISYVNGTLTVNPAAINMTGSRTYDGTLNFAASTFGTSGTISTGINSENLVLTGTGTVGNAHVVGGNNQTVTLGSLALTNGTGTATNYTFTAGAQSASVTAAPVSFTGTKIYDANTDFVASKFGTAGTINTGINAENLVLTGTGSVVSKNVVAGSQTVNPTGLTLNSGTGTASDYTFAGGTYMAGITAKAITASGITANNKVYNANDVAILNTSLAALTNGATTDGDNKFYTGDTLTLNTSGATGTFTSSAFVIGKNVGTGKAVSVSGLALTVGGDSGNYTLTGSNDTSADITAKALTASGLVGVNKVYNTTLVDTLSGTAVVANNAAADGDGKYYTADTVNVTGTPTGAFADKNVGTTKTVAITGLGVDNTNYTVSHADTSADITPKALTITGVTANNKVFDATPVATLGGTAAVTALGSNVVSVGGTGSGLFADSNVGTAKAVTVSGFTLGGTDAGNYTAVQPTGVTADITSVPTPTPASGILPAVAQAITALPGGADLLPAFSSSVAVAATQIDAVAPPPALSNLQYVYVTTTTPGNPSGDIDTTVDGEAVPTKAQGSKSDGFNERLPDAPIQFTGTVLVRNGGINLPSDADDSNERGKKIGNE